MEKFTCFTWAFKDSGFPNRLIFKGPEKPSGAPPPEPEKKWEDMSFTERARARARAKIEAAKKVAADARWALGETVKDYGRGAQQVGQAVSGTVREMPGVVSDAGGAVKKGAVEVGRGAAEFHSGMTEAGAEVIAGYVDWSSDKIARADRALREKAGAVWASIRPVAETLVGLGLLGKDAIASWGRDAKNFTVAKFNQSVDWAKFKAEYVKDGVVLYAKAAAAMGKDSAEFWKDVAADSYESAVAQGKRIVKVGGEYVYMTKEKAGAVASKVGKVVVGTGKEAWEIVRPGVETIVGLGLLAKDQVAKWGGDVSNWTVAQFNTVASKVQFAARYVKNGAVDVKNFAYEWGIKNPKEFWSKFAADTYQDAIATGKKFVKKGEQIYYVSKAEAEKYAHAAGKVIVGTAKEAYDIVAPGIETIAGLGLLAKDQIAEWGGDVKNWGVAKFNKVAEKVQFAARYVKDGVVDTAKLAYEFGLTKKQLFERFVADSYEDAVATSKRFVGKGQEVYDITTQKGRELLAQAQARGQEALGTGGGRPIPPEEARTAIARAPKATPGKAPHAAPRPVAPEGAGAVARPHDENLPPLVPLPSRSPEVATGEIEYIVKKGDNMWRILKKYYPANQVNQAFCDAVQVSSLGSVRRLPDGRKSWINPGDVIKIPDTFTYTDRRGKEITVLRNDELKRQRIADAKNFFNG